MRRIFLVVAMLSLAGCGAVKRQGRVSTPQAYASAQVATLEEVVGLINDSYAAVASLTVSSLKVSFVGGSVETGYMEEYRTAKAYLLAQSPDAVFVNILNPLTSSSVVTMAAVGKRFQIWLPSENKYITGDSQVQLQEENPILSVRPQHLMEGLLVESIPVGDPEVLYFMKETEDPRFKYYVVGVIEIDRGEASYRREIWIERSTMKIVRQNYYESGRLLSVITYGQPTRIEEKIINTSISIERKQENYRIDLELLPDTVRVNKPVKESAFEIRVPPGAEIIVPEGSP